VGLGRKRNELDDETIVDETKEDDTSLNGVEERGMSGVFDWRVVVLRGQRKGNVGL